MGKKLHKRGQPQSINRNYSNLEETELVDNKKKKMS